jgi:hypothetical protein
MAFVDEEGQNRWAPYRPPYRPPQAPQQPQQPTGSQIPNQGIYLQKQAQAEQAYQRALAQLAARKSQTFKNYGFLENGQVDPNATHGKIQDLWREQAGAAQQEDYSMLGRGIKGGLAGQVRTLAKLREGGQNLGLQNEYTGAMSDIANAATQAEADKNAAMLAIQQEAEQEARQNQQFTPADPEPDEPVAPARQLPARRVARRQITRARARRARGRRR